MKQNSRKDFPNFYFQYYYKRLITAIVLFMVLINIDAYSNICVKSERVYTKKVLDDTKPKTALFKLSLEDFSSFKIPDSSFLIQHAKITYHKVDKILKVFTKTPSKSIIIAQKDETLFFADLYTDHKEIVTKFEFKIGDEEKIQLILWKGAKIFVYSSINEKWKNTLLVREFDAAKFTHIKTRILITSVSQKDFVISDMIPDSSSKILPITASVFACNNMEIEYAYYTVESSEDSSRTIVSLTVTTEDRIEYMFLLEHIIQSDVIRTYSFWWASEEVPAGFPDVSSLDSIITVGKIIKTEKNLYKSTRIYYITGGKVDSIDFSFAHFLLDFPDNDEIIVFSNKAPILRRGENVVFLSTVYDEKSQIIGVLKADLDIKKKKVVSLNYIKMDEEFREKYGIEDGIVGAIMRATGYNNDDLIVCVEKVSTLGSSINGEMRGFKHEDYYLFCLNNEMKCKWAFSNQERTVHSTNQDYASCRLLTDYTKEGIFITTIDDEPEKGLWTIQIDSETGKVIKSQMLIDFSGMVLLTTDCLRYFTGEYYIALNTYTANEIEIFKRKN